ncbi:MAG: hypothetical protein JW384_00382 [Nitrosomonadaceae bacterium]|nr:hypothetical protein [Nitrosomonadaceae bacterium]
MHTEYNPSSLRLLAVEFLANPIGLHSIELERLLLKFRGWPLQNRLVVVCLNPYREWIVARLTGERGKPIEPVDNEVFNSVEDANRSIFRLRWKEEFGQELTI